MACMCFDLYETPKLSTNTDLSTPFLINTAGDAVDLNYESGDR